MTCDKSPSQQHDSHPFKAQWSAVVNLQKKNMTMTTNRGRTCWECVLPLYDLRYECPDVRKQRWSTINQKIKIAEQKASGTSFTYFPLWIILNIATKNWSPDSSCKVDNISVLSRNMPTIYEDDLYKNAISKYANLVKWWFVICFPKIW